MTRKSETKSEPCESGKLSEPPCLVCTMGLLVPGLITFQEPCEAISYEHGWGGALTVL